MAEVKDQDAIAPDEIIDAEYQAAKETLKNTPRRVRRWINRNLRKIGSGVMTFMALALAAWYFYKVGAVIMMAMATTPILMWLTLAMLAFALIVQVGTFLRLSW